MNRNLILIALALTAFFSCKKANDPDPNDTPATIEELLTAHTWKVAEIRIQQSNNVFSYYNRGGTTNTANYDADSIKFNSNNTGVYYNMGSITPLTWNFTNSIKTKMKLIINYPTPLTLNAENVFLGENTFYFSEYYNYAGINYVAYGLRVPN